MLDVSVVVPTRNAEQLIDDCLASIVRSAPREIIVVDGESTDRTLEIARRHPVRVLSDAGRGLPVARLLGAQAACSSRVALVDADVVLPDGALAALLEEFEEGGYLALQAGQHSTSPPGYWGRALAEHHRRGRSRWWFGLVATIFDRKALLEHGFDPVFRSGEDLELRWRLQRAGARIGVSRRTTVIHRFADDSFAFARGQWLADGEGLGRTLAKFGWRSAWLIGLPLLAGIRGSLLALARGQPAWILYYPLYAAFNYLGMARALRRRPSADGGRAERAPQSLSMLGNSLGLILGRAFSMGLGFLFWLFAARLFAPSVVGLTAGAVSAIMLCVQLAVLGADATVIAQYPRWLRRGEVDRLLDTAVTLVTLAALVVAALFLLLATGTFRELQVVGSLPAYSLLFLGMSVLGTVTLLLDHASTAQGRGDHVLARSAVNGLVTIAPLALLPLTTGTLASLRLFAAWVGGGLAACGLAFVQLGREPVRYRYRPRMDREVALAMVKVGLPNHALTLMERAPGLILPVVVTELLSPSVNAYWYTIWMMAWAAYFVPISMGISLFAEAACRPGSIRRQTRNAIRSSLVLGLAAAGAIGILGQPLLVLLGHGYASAGVTPLRILLLAVVPLSLVQAYFAVCRATGRLREVIIMGGASAFVAVAATALAGTLYGLTGMAVCWVAVQAVGGVWAAVRLRRATVPAQGPGSAEAEWGEHAVPAR